MGEAPKVFLKKSLKLIQIKIFFDDDFKESVRVTDVQLEMPFQPILNTICSKFSRESMPQTPIEGLKKFFPAAAWLKTLLQDRLPPPKQKILDRTLLTRVSTFDFMIRDPIRLNHYTTELTMKNS